MFVVLLSTLLNLRGNGIQSVTYNRNTPYGSDLVTFSEDQPELL